MTLKSVLTKMVPYINYPYAEHILTLLGNDPNAKATEEHVVILIEAARKCQEVAQGLEKQDSIRGFIVYEYAKDIPKVLKD